MRLKLVPPFALALLVTGLSCAVVSAAGETDPTVVLLNQARMWEGRNRLDLARGALDKLLRIIPDHPDALAELALLEIHAEQSDAARQWLARLRQVQPGHPAIARIEELLRLNGGDKARLRQMRQLSRIGQAEAALAAFKKLFPAGPPDAELTLEYWQLVASTGKDWEAAHSGLRQLAQDYPDNQRYRLALARHETSRLPLNLAALRVIIDLTKEPAHEREARAAWRQVVMRLDRSPASMTLLRDYLEQNPGDSAVQLRLQSFEQAEAAHRRLMADPAYRAKLEGLALLDSGQLDEAGERLDQALTGYPRDTAIIGGLGLVRLRQGRHAEAQAYFQQALQFDPAGRSKWKALIEAARFWGLMRASGEAQDAGEFDLAERKLRAAMRLQPQAPDALAALARLLVDQGRLAEAERTFQQALRIEPVNRGALRGLIALYQRQGRNDDLQSMIGPLSPVQRDALGPTLNAVQAGMLRDKADRLLAQGQTEAAAAMLGQAVATDPDDPWLRLALARLYARQGNKAQGQALFDELLSRHSHDAEVLYALAVYQSGQDETLPALATLERVAKNERSVNMTALQRRLWMQVEGQRARTLAGARQLEAARDILRRAEPQVADDVALTLALASAWADLGDRDHARGLVDRLRNGTTPLPRDWPLRYAIFLGGIRADAELQMALDQIAAAGDLSAEDATTVAELRESTALRAADALRRAGQPKAALKRLAPLLAATPDRIALRLAEASLLAADHRLTDAEHGYRSILARHPENPDAREGLIRTLVEAGKRDEALALIEQELAQPVQVEPGDVERRQAMTGYLLELKAYPRARAETQSLLAVAPNNARVLSHAEQLARQDGQLDQSIDYLQRALAAEQATGDGGNSYQYRRLADMLDQRTPWLSSAIDWRSRSGTAGVSQFDSVEIPIEWKTPWRASDQLNWRADIVRLDAGVLDLADTAASRRFGSMLLCQPNCATDLTRQSATGLSFNAGHQREGLQMDIGTSPLGFPVANLLGGIRQKGDLGPFSYSAEASRRAVTSSLLSFAGTRDPRTGVVWGGVVATGVRLGLSRDDGGALGAWSSLGVHQLTGQNVQSNDRMQLMAGGYWRIVNEDNRLFTLGITGMYWRFKENAGEYTFGHGGYYSPQEYRSLSFPVTFGQRLQRLSYVLRAAVSTSQSSFNDAPYFPTDGALQTQAGDPRYAASSGPGTGSSFSAAFEYQLNPRLFLGGRLEIERSDYYAPNRALLYIRQSLGRSAAQPVLLPPEPVLPTSQF
jgi:tetratricopeptide (TPR) repeat protein